MRNSYKLIITQDSRFALLQNRVGLLSNETMQQKRRTCPQTIKQYCHETHIPPSELKKLMTPPNRLCTHKKQSFMGRRCFKMKDPHCTETWKYFSKVLWQSWPDHIGRDKSTSLPSLGEELMMETWMSTGERPRRTSPPPHFFLDYKTSPLSFQGMVFLACPLVRTSSVESLSRVRLFVTTWTAACQASLSIAITSVLS